MGGLEVRVACQQIPPEVGQLERNRALTQEAVREAVAAGARLVVLPELSNSGYVFESPEEARACAEPADGATLRAWSEEAERGDAVVVGGFCELGEGGAGGFGKAVQGGECDQVVGVGAERCRELPDTRRAGRRQFTALDPTQVARVQIL